MGATTFYTRAKGASPLDAFHKARAEARHDYGHAGYSGTIAEKEGFEIIDKPAGDITAVEYARALIEKGDPRVSDKWGPAGCIADGDDYLFFGWASE